MKPKEPISNESFIEWTKDIFKSKVHGPLKMYAYSEKTRQFLIDKGIPADMIEVLNPIPQEDEERSNS